MIIAGQESNPPVGTPVGIVGIVYFKEFINKIERPDYMFCMV